MRRSNLQVRGKFLGSKLGDVDGVRRQYYSRFSANYYFPAFLLRAARSPLLPTVQASFHLGIVH